MEVENNHTNLGSHIWWLASYTTCLFLWLAIQDWAMGVENNHTNLGSHIWWLVSVCATGLFLCFWPHELGLGAKKTQKTERENNHVYTLGIIGQINMFTDKMLRAASLPEVPRTVPQPEPSWPLPSHCHHQQPWGSNSKEISQRTMPTCVFWHSWETELLQSLQPQWRQQKRASVLLWISNKKQKTGDSAR